MAIRDNDLAAEVMGINLFRYKLTAFFIGCFYAGIAGSLLAHTSRSISADYFPFMDSVLFIGMIIIGGLGTTLGPILGVIFHRLLDVLVTEAVPGAPDPLSRACRPASRRASRPCSSGWQSFCSSYLSRGEWHTAGSYSRRPTGYWPFSY